MRFFLVLIFLLHIGHTSSAGQLEILSRANALYQSGSFEQAALLYEQLEPKNSYIFHMLARCLLELQDYPRALSFSLKADQNVSYGGYIANQRLKNEISDAYYANQGIFHEISESFTNSIKLFFVYFFYKTPLFLWQIACLLSWFFLLCITWHFVVNPYKRSTSKKLLLGLTVLLVSIIFLHLVTYVSEQKKVYGVTKAETVLYLGPDEQYHQAGNVDALQVVEVVRLLPDWYRLKLPNGKFGWVRQSSILL